MSITGPGAVQGGFAVRPQQQTVAPSTRNSIDPPLTPKDELEISSVGKMLNELQQSGVRAERLALIKSQIEAGVYETPEKLEAALNRLLDEVRKEAGDVGP
jgi:negative regulator of flagellin synthesis FlgM